MANILIVDEEKNILSSLETFLTIKNYTVYTAVTVKQGENLVNKVKPEVVILDVFLKGDSGIELLKKIVKKNNHIYVIMISGHADIKTTKVYAKTDTETKRKAIENAYPDLIDCIMPDWCKDKELLSWLSSLK